MSLENKVAIVTGGASGIGYAIAEKLVRNRVKVVIADIDKKIGKKAAIKLQKINSATFVHCDVSQKLDVHNLVAATLDIYDKIDILVNNAAIINHDDFLNIEEKDFDHVLSVNLKGTFLCAQATAKQMIRQVENGEPAGTIINLSSVNAIFAIANQIPNYVAKGSINPLTKVMALSLKEYGITVNAIGPGSVISKILKTTEESDAKKEKMELLVPEEIAEAVIYLASNEKPEFTGQTIYSDSVK